MSEYDLAIGGAGSVSLRLRRGSLPRPGDRLRAQPDSVREQYREWAMPYLLTTR